MNRFALAALVLIGCAGDPGSSDKQDFSLTDQGTAVQGRLAIESGTIEFTSREMATDVFEVTLVVNGVTLEAIIDYANSAVEMDGFISDTGQSTLLDPADREMILALADALADKDLGQREAVYTRGVSPRKRPGVVLLRILSSWGTLSVDAPLERSIKWDNGRTVDTTCGALSGMGLYGSHDCWDCWDYGDCYNWVNIGPTPDWSTGRPGPNSQICYTDANNCSHNRSGEGNGQWQYGDYFGRCDLTNIGEKYTVDCVRHDHCVRNGHMGASLYCDDEDGTNALDDVVGYFDCTNVNGCYGACGGYSASGCYCDEACATYGDCCADKLAYCGGAY